MFAQEMAEDFIYNFLADNGQDTERISDTGTIDNLREEGFTLENISSGRVPGPTILDNIAWLY